MPTANMSTSLGEAVQVEIATGTYVNGTLVAKTESVYGNTGTVVYVDDSGAAQSIEWPLSQITY